MVEEQVRAARTGGSPGARWQDEAWFAHVAQLVEHTLGKGEVIGSIPIVSSAGAVVVRRCW